MVKIVQSDNKVLREIAKEVPADKITTPEIKKIISDMKEALLSQNDGVALAAPQIGISLRIFIISGRVFDDEYVNGKIDINGEIYKPHHKDLIFINPVIKKISGDRKLMDEGCLSVRPLFGRVRRASRATIEAYDENGKKFTRSASGLLAQAFQHETDHLEGILFTDKAKDIK